MNANRWRLTPLLLFLLSGCGTVAHGPLQQIHVDSEPQGAVVRATGCGTSNTTFVTPGKFWASRRSTHCSVRIAAEGYDPFEVTLQRRHSAQADPDEGVGAVEFESPQELLAGLVLIGLVDAGSAAIDWATGGMYELEPSTILVRLSPRTGTPPGSALHEVPQERRSR